MSEGGTVKEGLPGSHRVGKMSSVSKQKGGLSSLPIKKAKCSESWRKRDSETREELICGLKGDPHRPKGRTLKTFVGLKKDSFRSGGSMTVGSWRRSRLKVGGEGGKKRKESA